MKFNFILYSYYRFHIKKFEISKIFYLFRFELYYIRLEHMKFNSPEIFELDLN